MSTVTTIQASPRPAPSLCGRHFAETDSVGNCLQCGGRPGSSSARRTNEHD